MSKLKDLERKLAELQKDNADIGAYSAYGEVMGEILELLKEGHSNKTTNKNNTVSERELKAIEQKYGTIFDKQQAKINKLREELQSFKDYRDDVVEYDLEVSVRREKSLLGMIFTDETSSGMHDAEVEIDGNSGIFFLRTNYNGKCEKTLPEGNYTVTVTDEDNNDYESKRVTLDRDLELKFKFKEIKK
jgi:hypothetical protein